MRLRGPFRELIALAFRSERGLKLLHDEGMHMAADCARFSERARIETQKHPLARLCRRYCARFSERARIETMMNTGGVAPAKLRSLFGASED